MLLKTVLDEHKKHSSASSLKDNLGDGYLLTHNPIHARIRSEVKKAGFKLSSKRFYDYEVLPLTQLPKILRKKIIPYTDNVTALMEIEKKAPAAFNLDEVPPLKANYIFHESAHAVAHFYKTKFFGKKLPQKHLILCTLLEESFSNTAECLANLDAKSEAHDEFLYKNSYIMEKPKDRVLLKQAEELIGRRALFRLMILAYLQSNFLKTNTALEDFERVLNFTFDKNYTSLKRLTEPQISLLKKTFQIGLRLDPGFTIFTNSFCFRLMGIKESIYDFLAFDFIKILETNKNFKMWLKSLEVLF